MSKEQQYLDAISGKLHEYAETMRDLTLHGAELKQAVHDMLEEATEFEAKCRAEYDIGPRFIVIQQQLSKLKDEFQEDVSGLYEQLEHVIESAQPKEEIATVYVYLFNTQGNRLSTWIPLFSMRALSEHSVNRPIYPDEKSVINLLRTKRDPAQHGFIQMRVNKSAIIQPKTPLKDSQGSPLIRLQQGSLVPDHIERFYHKGTYYRLTSKSELVPDESFGH